MMFPFADTESDDITEEEYVPKEYGIDFKTGQLSGKIVEGVDALMVWCWIALHTGSDVIHLEAARIPFYLIWTR